MLGLGSTNFMVSLVFVHFVLVCITSVISYSHSFPLSNLYNELKVHSVFIRS